MRPTRLLPVLLLLLACRAAPPSEQQAALPPGQLPELRQLPDPFALGDGVRVRGARDWNRRRQQIVDLVLRYQYGHPPPAPGRITARVLRRRRDGGQLLRLSFGPGRRLYLYLGLFRPPGPGPHPTIVHIDHRGPFAVPLATVRAILARGYALAGFDPGVLDPDEPGLIGPAQAAYPDHDWATLAVWAWGASRVADYLATRDWVDSERLVVTGHSRSGKAALLAGALDRRFALTAPQGSGTGGAASYRFRGPGAEPLANITRTFPHWFLPGLARFAGQETRLPLDQHFLLALVAPRALITLDALGDRWANPLGTQVAHQGARPVFLLLGAGQRLGLHFRPGRHELAAEDWRTLLGFADPVLHGRDPGPRFRRLPLSLGQQPFTWRAPR